MAGFEKEIKEKVFSFMTHIQIEGYQNQPLKNYKNTIELVQKNVNGIKKIAPYVSKEAMIRAGDYVDGVFLKGIDVNLDATAIRKYMKEGKYLSENPYKAEIVIGKKLAYKLNVNIGDKVIIFGLPYEQKKYQPKFTVLQVTGIFESGMAEYDDIYAITNLYQAQKLFNLEDAVTGYDVIVDSVQNINLIAKNLQNILDYPHFVRTAPQLYHNLFAWVELQKKPAPIFLGLIIIVAVVNIIGTLLMMVIEKMHDIGVLKSLGASSRDIKAIFVAQGLTIAIIGTILGNLIAFILCEAQIRFQFFSLPSDIYFMSTVPILLKYENFILVSLLVVILAFISSLIPSRAAAKLDTVNILRFG
ncbi:MAG: Lipoprotein releasing system transmembrane protein LolC [Ignavibacteriae bacterium]|nr:MAG: Lipoprotein releasing system transmembrane protein LolC [Ignavibacteriota bacterium]